MSFCQSTKPGHLQAKEKFLYIPQVYKKQNKKKNPVNSSKRGESSLLRTDPILGGTEGSSVSVKGHKSEGNMENRPAVFPEGL